ncbi:MAG: hypothetical protein HY820_38190 [Acidobacteria bacterium]|nr:hypothetical protein [Acidobacteriota bacterium]
MRPVVLGLGVAVCFLVTIGILWQLMPYPRREIDYLIMGGAASMVAMAVLFIALIKTSLKGSDIFFRRRKD